MALTQRKRAFAAALVGGATQLEAASIAGYADPKSSARRAMRCPHVIAHAERLKRYAHLPPRPATDDPQEFLRNLMADPREPTRLRLDAAKALVPLLYAKPKPARR